VLNADEPEALIYEPISGGALRLVGVEFIVWSCPGSVDSRSSSFLDLRAPRTAAVGGVCEFFYLLGLRWVRLTDLERGERIDVPFARPASLVFSGFFVVLNWGLHVFTDGSGRTGRPWRSGWGARTRASRD
jgi:hypothetical protein